MADGEQQQHTWATELEQRVDDRIAGIELAIARKLNIDVRDQR